MRKNGTLYFLLSDHLGSTSLTADASGNVISELRYTAWGEVRYNSGVTPTQYQYTGQYSDSYINLLWYGSRHYDPALGRFISPDSIVPLASQGVQAYDRYAYANNNPVHFTDPTGHSIDCGIGESYCGAGKLNVKKRATDLAMLYYHRTRTGTRTQSTVYWIGLPYGDKTAQSILSEGGWGEGAFNDLVSHGGVSKADALHDPATYAVAAVGGAGLLRAGYGALVSYATVGAEAEMASIGSNGLYQKPGFAFFEIKPDALYTALDKIGLAKLLNTSVINNVVAQEKNVVVSLREGVAGAGTQMEMEILRNSGQYIEGTANWLGVDKIFQVSPWQWLP